MLELDEDRRAASKSSIALVTLMYVVPASAWGIVYWYLGQMLDFDHSIPEWSHWLSEKLSVFALPVLLLASVCLCTWYARSGEVRTNIPLLLAGVPGLIALLWTILALGYAYIAGFVLSLNL